MNGLPLDPAFLLATASIASIRTFVAFSMLPLFAGKLVPGIARGGLAMAIVMPVIARHLAEPFLLDTSATGLLLMALREGAVGVVIGLGFGAFCAGLSAAGELIDHQTGLTFTQNIDPMNGNQTSLSALFLQQVLFTVLMVAGFMLLLADALYLSYEFWPIGQPLPDFERRVPLTLVIQSGRVFSLALLLAGPVMLVLFVIDVSASMLNRAAPQLNIFNLTLSFKSLVGLAVLALALPVMIERVVVLMLQVAAEYMALIRGAGG
jgi:type III secretion protein T